MRRHAENVLRTDRDRRQEIRPSPEKVWVKGTEAHHKKISQSTYTHVHRKEHSTVFLF